MNELIDGVHVVLNQPKDLFDVDGGSVGHGLNLGVGLDRHGLILEVIGDG